MNSFARARTLLFFCSIIFSAARSQADGSRPYCILRSEKLAEMDAAIDLLRTADTDAKRTEAYKQISIIWVRDMPAHVIAIIPQAIVSTPKMHDIVRTGSSITLYDKAWLEK